VFVHHGHGFQLSLGGSHLFHLETFEFDCNDFVFGLVIFVESDGVATLKMANLEAELRQSLEVRWCRVCSRVLHNSIFMATLIQL
jgi:hypothetical protein